MIRVSLSGRQKSIDAVLEWHQTATRALRNQLALERVDVAGPSESSAFFGLTAPAVDEFFAELDLLTMLDLLSATEAALRVDFWDRVHHRLKDEVSRGFRELARLYDDRIALDEHLMSEWLKARPGAKSSVADFRGAMKLRNWLAHGRYWTPKLAQQTYTPADVYDICDAVLRAVDLK